MNNLLVLSSLLIIILVLLNLKSGFNDNINQNNQNKQNSQNNQNIKFLIHYTVPVDGIYKWPLLYLIESPNNAEYLNAKPEYLKPPPGILSGSKSFNDYLPNLLDFTNIYSEKNIYLASDKTTPSIDKTINNNYTNDILNKGDSPYYIISTVPKKQLVNNNKYVLGIALQFDKDYVNINGTTRYVKDPLIKYRYSKFTYIDLIYNNNKLVELNTVLGDTEIISGDFIL